MVVLYQPKYGQSTGQWRLRGWGRGGSGPGVSVLVLLWVVVESQNDLGFCVGRDIKDHLVPSPSMGRDTFHKPHKMLLGLCLGTRAEGRCLCHLAAALGMEGGGVLPMLQPAPAPKRTCRRQRRGESGRNTRDKGETSRTFSHLSSKKRASQFHGTFSVIDTPAAPGDVGLLCLGVRWGWCSQTVTNSSQPVASFCDDSQNCVSPSCPRLGQTPAITPFIFPSLVLEGSWT